MLIGNKILLFCIKLRHELKFEFGNHLFQYKPTRDKLRTADIWEIENHRKIAENKIKHNRAWVPITEPEPTK